MEMISGVDSQDVGSYPVRWNDKIDAAITERPIAVATATMPERTPPGIARDPEDTKRSTK